MLQIKRTHCIELEVNEQTLQHVLFTAGSIIVFCANRSPEYRNGPVDAHPTASADATSTVFEANLPEHYDNFVLAAVSASAWFLHDFVRMAVNGALGPVRPIRDEREFIIKALDSYQTWFNAYAVIEAACQYRPHTPVSYWTELNDEFRALSSD